MGIKKQSLKSKPLCKVTFEISPDFIGQAEKVSVLGSFNNWTPGIHNMKKLKDGTFKTTIDLPVNENHSFRYLVDDSKWLTDMEADKLQASGFGQEQNSVITL
jgi:1,4-alpha-glucan branching enzyme